MSEVTIDPVACAIPTPGGQPERTWVGPNAAQRLALLRRTRSIAVVGASANASRASYFVATYLLSSSPYDVYFVNPRASEILGRPVYPSLDALPVVPDLEIPTAQPACPSLRNQPCREYAPVNNRREKG